MIPDEEIEKAKKITSYSSSEAPRHEHNDCIRMAYEWLDAQKKIEQSYRKARALKHIIEKWAGRYVSESDVEVAATLHPEVFGRYPFFNISARLVELRFSRLENLGEANSQPSYRRGYDPKVYSTQE